MYIIICFCLLLLLYYIYININMVAGFMSGLGKGIVGGTALAVGGAVTGLSQVCRGIYHTPGAIKASQKGQVWDEDKQCWIDYSLTMEANQFLTMSDEEYLKYLMKVSGDNSSDNRAIADEGGGHEQVDLVSYSNCDILLYTL
jgi:hypothetical protein